jgi:hypothetical protein
MRGLTLTLWLTSSVTINATALANSTPSWIGGGSLSDATYSYVICSHDGIDPEEVKQVAESKCLASAAKLGGVTVTIREKTVQSLTGADSSEVAEITPLRRDIRCEWTDRYMERVGEGFRVWLRCKVKKGEIRSETSASVDASLPVAGIDSRLAKEPYKRGLLVVTTTPKADRILVSGARGERVIEVISNVMRIEIREGDDSIVVKKQGFKDARKVVPEWSHGHSVSITLFLDQGL